jgi:hypothetical protein
MNVTTAVVPYISGICRDQYASHEQSGRYFTEYPEDIHLYGVSWNTIAAEAGGIALQGELSYRPTPCRCRSTTWKCCLRGCRPLNVP